MDIDFNDIDWNRIWKTQMMCWRKTSGKSCSEFWADEKSARVYSDKYGKHHRERIEKTLQGLGLTPESRVLDIGAGPGNLALPMAALAGSVTTVEPSPGMNAVMASEMAQSRITNIVRIEKTWEKVDLKTDLEPPYDLVLASMSLGMPDIRAALEKMNGVCNGQVVLFWHAGIPGWEIMPRALWPDLFDTDYHGGPKSDVLFQVLYQMGIYPEIRVFSNHFTEVFRDMDTAVDFYYRRFDQLRPEHRPALVSFLNAHCSTSERGLVHGFDHQSMRFAWRPEKFRQKETRPEEACRETA